MRHAACLGLVVWLAAASVATALEVPVTVEETAGVARVAEPVSGGISLPPGQFKPGKVSLALFDGEKAVPAQVTELVVGPNGDVTWVLLDCQLDLKAHETKTLTLKDGKPALSGAEGAAAPATPLKVRESADGVTVDTGKVAFTVSKTKPFGLVENVTVAGKPVVTGGTVSYVNAADDKAYKAAAPTTVKVHYAGPMRVTLEVRGGFKGDDDSKLRFCTYITAWAGRSDIEVKHSLINSREDTQYYVKLGGSAIQLDLAAGDKAAVRDGGDWAQCGSVWAADRLFKVDGPRLLTAKGGALVLDAAPPRSAAPAAAGAGRRSGGGANRWLFDCSHHSSEYRIDFAAAGDEAGGLNNAAKAAASRVWGVAPGSWYSQCQVLAVGKFGTLDDEKACHKAWDWKSGREPEWKNPRPFVGWEDNHYESEADSAEAMILMYLRTGKRGFLDEGEAWVRYHTDLQAWRTEGWKWKDGGIWWPKSDAFGGNRKARKAVPPRNEELWHIAIAKACYCHFYGAGLVDWFCLTGDRDALDAAIDNCQMKYDEETHYRNFQPGKNGVGSTRGFGRGFYVAMRAYLVAPQNEVLKKLVALSRDQLAKLPPKYLDERGVYADVMDKAPDKQHLTPGIVKYMEENGITLVGGQLKDKAGRTWPWKEIEGTWMISYLQFSADDYAQLTGDEDMMDYAIGAGEFAAKFMLSPAAKQTWYVTAMDIPVLGQMWDPWLYDGLPRNKDGEGQVHSGWYTRFFPDACARAYSWTGEKYLLDKGKEFWDYGGRREYQTKTLTADHKFAGHTPPKDDQVLSTSRLFYEGAHPRKDAQAPAAVADLAVRLLGGGKAEVSFTAPADQGGGKVARYQVKCDPLPLVAYDQWDYARDLDKKRNWWHAVNCQGEPAPAAAGKKEKFVVSNVPDGEKVFFAVRTFDDSSNRSPISNCAAAGK